MSTVDAKKFEQVGFMGPFRALDIPAAEDLCDDYYLPTNKLTWYKSLHEKSSRVVNTATSSAILDRLKPILGENILLWGSQFIGQRPKQSHGWHLDVEHGRWNGVTLWLGLKNLNKKTSISVITRSHLLSVMPQELAKQGVDIYDEKAILAAAQKLDPACELVTLHLEPGEFIVWSGKVWHTTHNHSEDTRFSLILQYCTPDNTVKIPLNYDYPDTKWAEGNPPCFLVSGNDDFQRNVVLKKESVQFWGEGLRAYFLAISKTRYFLGGVKRKILQKA